MSNILVASDLRKEYKEFVLDDVSLNIPKGYIVGLIGPNGAGKTTTIKIITNLIKADSGTVEIFGLNYKSSEKEIKNRVGYVGEDQYFYENKRVSWTGNFVSKFYNQWDENKFASLLNDFQISRSKKVKELSKGMRVKLSFAIALAHNPELLVLDEPTSGLDPVIRREILDLLMGLIEDENRSVLISSHITDDISRIADYVAYMINGKIKVFEEKDILLASWKKIHFRKGSLNGSILDSLYNINDNVFGVSGITRNYQTLKGKLEKGIEEGYVKVENMGLDDILISFVKGR